MERQIFDYSLMLYRIQIHQGASAWLMQVNRLHNMLMPEQKIFKRFYHLIGITLSLLAQTEC